MSFNFTSNMDGVDSDPMWCVNRRKRQRRESGFHPSMDLNSPASPRMSSEYSPMANPDACSDDEYSEVEDVENSNFELNSLNSQKATTPANNPTVELNLDVLWNDAYEIMESDLPFLNQENMKEVEDLIPSEFVSSKHQTTTEKEVDDVEQMISENEMSVNNDFEENFQLWSEVIPTLTLFDKHPNALIEFNSIQLQPLDDDVNNQLQQSTVICDGYSIPRHILEIAFKTNCIRAAEMLFQHFFSTEEVNNSNLSGKNGANILDRVKLLTIIRLVGFMRSYWEKGLKQFPLDFDCTATLCTPLSKVEIKSIERQVFTQFRNQYSRRKRKLQVSNPEISLISIENYNLQLVENLINNELVLLSNIPETTTHIDIEWQKNCFIPRSVWASAFYEQDNIHTAGILFDYFFTKEEIQNSTLNGKKTSKENKKTEILCLSKRKAIYQIVHWMKDKGRNPYDFSPLPLDFKVELPEKEQDDIKVKIFTQRRSQLNIALKANQLHLAKN